MLCFTLRMLRLAVCYILLYYIILLYGVTMIPRISHSLNLLMSNHFSGIDIELASFFILFAKNQSAKTLQNNYYGHSSVIIYQNVCKFK